MKALLRPAFVLGLSIAIAAASLVGSSSVAVAAVGPRITFWELVNGPSNGPVTEGDRPSVRATFTDPDLLDVHTVNIDWNDGTAADVYTLPVGARDFGLNGLQKTVPFANDQPDAFLVVITLSDGPVFSNTKTLSVTVSNAAPSFTSFELSPTDVETDKIVTANGVFTDRGSNDTHTLTLNWGDLTETTVSLGAALSFTESHAFTTAGIFTVTATVSDNADTTVATSTVGVHVRPNQAPSIASFEVAAAPEGGSSTLALGFTDADVLDTHTVSVNWGDGVTTDSEVLAAGDYTFDAAHVYADNGTYDVVLTLKDSGSPALTASMTKSISPANVRPQVGSLALSPSSVVDGQLLTVSGRFTDPGTLDSFTLTVDWQDGTPPSEQSLQTAGLFSATHTYDAAGSFTITVTVKDRDGATSLPSSVLAVVLSSNHAPTGLAILPTASGATVLLSGTFSDADLDDTHDLAVSWGDGASTNGSLAEGAGSFTVSHVYAASGTYTVIATVTDPDRASTNDTRTVVVTVPAASPSAVLDEMASLVLSFNLDRNTERWLMRRLDDLRGSLAYGNDQICSTSGTLAHLVAFAQRTLTPEQYAALSADSAQLQTAAGCTSAANQLPKVQEAAAVTTAATPSSAPKKDTTTQVAAKDTAKSRKAESKAMPGRSAH